jgi:hypothetical protein
MRFLSAILLLFFSTSLLFAAEPVVINFSPKDKVTYTRWESTASFARIQRWAQTRELVPLADSNPIIDNEAAFVSKFGSTVVINNLDPQKNYTLYIDFVKFSKGNGGITSRLAIYADNKRIAEIKYGDQNSEGLFSVAIPRETIYDGSVALLFKEFATTSGVWGIWDMIVTDEKLPEQIKIAPEIPPIKTDEEKKIREVKPDYNKKDQLKKKAKNAETQETKPEAVKKKDDDKIIEPVIEDVKAPDDTKTPKKPEVDDKSISIPTVKEPDIRD